MAFFVGGQLMLAAVVVPVLRGAPDREPLRAAARRFGIGTLIAVGVLVITGTMMASHYHRWSDSTLQVKLGLVVLVVILIAAHLFGRPLTDEDARLLDVLLVLGIDVGAVKLRRGAIQALGQTYPVDDLRGVGADALARRVSARLGIQVTARLARRRAHIILGREIPVLGVGLAAGYNLRSTRNLGDTAVRFFRHVS